MAVELGTVENVPNPSGLPLRTTSRLATFRSASEGTTSSTSSASSRIPEINFSRPDGASSTSPSPGSPPPLEPSRPKTASSFSQRASSFFQHSNASAIYSSSDSAVRHSSATSLCAKLEDKKTKGNVLRKVQNCASKEDDQSPPAWVSGYRGRVPYDLEDLISGQFVPELWDESGDCLIYLFPPELGKPASFKVRSKLFASSRRLHSSASKSSRDSFDHISYEKHLYMSIDAAGLDDAIVKKPGSLSDEEEALVSIRNLFAFLMRRSLVATQRCPTVFDIFLSISKQLKYHEFSNIDGSSFGQVVTANFDAYVDEFELADVRFSEQKTVEGIVLGERMRNVKLYNEAFTHAAGKHELIQTTRCDSMPLVSAVTRNRLGRASLNLEKHTAIVQETLNGLDFPSLFTGTMSSRGGRRQVYFSHWRDSFLATRKWYIHFYKGRYKKWPPRTSRSTAGINRVILQDLFRDLCSVYDLLVDRSRTGYREDHSNDNLSDESGIDDPRRVFLRQVLDAYDFSSPPVKPGIPFNIPLLPSLCSVGLGLNKKVAAKKIKDETLLQLLKSSHNTDVEASDFTAAFEEMERKSGHSHKIEELDDNRIGQWIFIYVMLQIFPLLAVDAPDLEHTDGVEYFLCEPPRSGVPWAGDDAPKSRRPILGVPNVRVAPAVSLPADLAGPAIESNFYRSHCWIKADEWNNFDRIPPARSGLGQRAITDPLLSTSASFDTLRETEKVVPRRLNASSSSQSLDVPKSRARSERAARTVSVYDPTRTFDSILTSSIPNSRSSSPGLSSTKS